MRAKVVLPVVFNEESGAYEPEVGSFTVTRLAASGGDLEYCVAVVEGTADEIANLIEDLGARQLKTVSDDEPTLDGQKVRVQGSIASKDGTGVVYWRVQRLNAEDEVTHTAIMASPAKHLVLTNNGSTNAQKATRFDEMLRLSKLYLLNDQIDRALEANTLIAAEVAEFDAWVASTVGGYPFEREL